MPYTEILEDCVHSIGGIKSFKISSRKTDGSPIEFPLDVTFQSGSTDTIIISEDYDNRIITIGSDEYSFKDVYPDNCTFVEEEVKTRQGNFFRKTLTFEMPKVNPTTQNQLKEFLFTAEGEFALANTLIFLTDANDQNWFLSIDLPFVLNTYDTTTGKNKEDNKYVLQYKCDSYMRALKYITQ